MGKNALVHPREPFIEFNIPGEYPVSGQHALGKMHDPGPMPGHDNYRDEEEEPEVLPGLGAFQGLSEVNCGITEDHEQGQVEERGIGKGTYD